MQKNEGYIGVIKRNTTPIFSFINLSLVQGSNVFITLLLFPIIFRIVGIAEFGFVGVSSSYAAVISILVNYGSSQSGVKDTAVHKAGSAALSDTFYSIYIVRLFFFLLSFVVLLAIPSSFLPLKHYFILASAIILAEALNPLFFFVGMQKLFLYNIVNLVAKIISAVLIIVLVTSPAKSEWVNFYLGLPGIIGNLLLCIYLVKRYKLYQYKIPLSTLGRYLKENFYLTGNNMSVQLQQSFFLFAVSGLHDPLLLGAYTLCDKIVWSFRLLIISFFNAIYPKAVNIFTVDPGHWKRFRKKLNLLLFIVFMGVAGVLYLFPDFVVLLITGKNNALASSFIRATCLLPLVAALNSINVIDLLMMNRYKYIFFIALILLSVSVIVSEIFIHSVNTHFFGYYPIIVEIFSLPLYMYFIHRSIHHPAANR